jgi:hypothetical protein
MTASPFRAVRSPALTVRVELSDQERDALAHLLDEVTAMLVVDPEQVPGAGAQDTQWQVLEAALAAPAPRDPAVARLLPDGSRDDPEAAQGFRRLTEHGLREAKQQRLSAAAQALRGEPPVELAETEAVQLLKGLTDVRLVLAERLGLRTDADAEHMHEETLRRLGALAEAETTGDEAVRPDLKADPYLHLALMYDVLTGWQECLVHELS